ncbi:MAG: ATP-dependent DNA helicase [Candidatus Bathyarchaeota archaeon]|nr:ATP-dependent DNA helicase [Candidatus Bathyarchaeota archaeon]
MNKLAHEVADYFPYAEVRRFQDDFINTIHSAIEECRSVIIEGSNGLGKTVAALSACLPEVVENKLKVLFVARTHRQHDRIIEELGEISKKQPVTGISVRGKREMCLNHVAKAYSSDLHTFMEICELLKARKRCPLHQNIEYKSQLYFEILEQVALRPYKASEIQSICRRYGFCSYELVKGALSEVSVVALSYLYVFDPTIRNVFLKNLETPLDRIVLIIDEAHNLPETAVDIASSTLPLFTVRPAENEARKFRHREVEDFANALKVEIEKMAGNGPKEQLVSESFISNLIQERAGENDFKKFCEVLHSKGDAIKRSLFSEGKYPRSYIHGLSEFLKKWLETTDDDAYIRTLNRYISRRGGKTAKLEIAALDPAKITAPVFSSTYCNVVMSGTLQPLEAYRKMTQLPEDTIRKVVPAPFPREHILPLVCCGVTTAMEKRTPEMYNKLVKRICEVTKNTPKNTGVFAASFEVLESLVAAGLEKTLDKELFRERKHMNSRENEKMVAAFKKCANKDGAVLLGAQGGRSSEGVDFPGDQMNSVVIVGLPYAEPTPRVKAQINYFEKMFPGYGREYGYVLPAMKKASQAAGRPIRTPTDKGAIILMDYRFAAAYCKSFLPAWIRDHLKIVPEEEGAISRELSWFFKKVS